jgi:hypothetical protein
MDAYIPSDLSTYASLYSNISVYVTYDGMIFDTFEEAESYMTPSVRLYFYNSEGWDFVDAYVYVEATNEQLTMGWPGYTMNKEGSEDWWYIDIPIDPSKEPIVVVFNNFDADELTPDYQTADIYLDTYETFYITAYNGVYPSKTDALNSLVPTTLYFYNSDAWAYVYAYIYSDEGELLGAWPGTQAVQDGVSMYWTVEVPVNPIYQEFYIIFHDNSGYGTGLETPAMYVFNNIDIYATVLGNLYPSMIAAETDIATALSNNTVVITRLNNSIIGTRLVAVWTWGSGVSSWVLGTYNDGTFTFNMPEGDTNFIFVVFNEGITTPDWGETNVYRQSSSNMYGPQIIFNGVYYIA